MVLYLIWGRFRYLDSIQIYVSHCYGSPSMCIPPTYQRSRFYLVGWVNSLPIWYYFLMKRNIWKLQISIILLWRLYCWIWKKLSPKISHLSPQILLFQYFSRSVFKSFFFVVLSCSWVIFFSSYDYGIYPHAILSHAMLFGFHWAFDLIFGESFVPNIFVAGVFFI